MGGGYNLVVGCLKMAKQRIAGKEKLVQQSGDRPVAILVSKECKGVNDCMGTEGSKGNKRGH